MNIMEISEENLEDFLPLLGEDMSEDVKRVYYNGIGAVNEDGKAVGAFVYELLNAESEEDTKGRICFFKSESEEVLNGIGDYYDENCAEEEDVVETFYEFESEENAKLLEEIGFSLGKKESDTISITLGEISKTELGNKKNIPSYVGNIEELSILQFRDAVKQILFKGHTGVYADIPYLPKNWFDNSVSACISSGGKNPGLFLIRRNPSGVLIPVLFFAYGPEYQKNLIYMMRYSVQQALALYPPDTVVKIKRSSAAARALTGKLLPGRSGMEIFFGERREQ